MDREGGQGGSAMAIQISQAGWTDGSYLSVCLSIYSGSQKYVPTFEPTLHQDFQLWLCGEVVGHTQGLQSWDTHLAGAPTLG